MAATTSATADVVRNGVLDCVVVVGIDEVASTPAPAPAPGPASQAPKGKGQPQPQQRRDAAQGGKRAAVRWRFPASKQKMEGMSGDLGEVAPFCFPNLGQERRRAHLRPSSYVFALTLEGGKFLYGFCRKVLPRGDLARGDMAERFPEVLCVLSTRFEADLYERVLDCLMCRRLLEPGSCADFLGALGDFHPLPAPGGAFRIRSAVAGVLCEYKLKRPLVTEKARADAVLLYLTPKMLHFVVGAVMTESRVIFVSRSASVISTVVHGIIALLYPFVWQHMFVPLMPEHLLEYLAAPSPYMVGVVKALEPRLQKLPLGDVVIADLDKNEVRSSQTVLPFGEVAVADRGKGKGKGRGKSKAGAPAAALARARERQGQGEDAARVSSAFASDVAGLFSKAGAARSVDERALRSLWLTYMVVVFGWVGRFGVGDAADATVDKDRFAASAPDPRLRSFLKAFVGTQMFDNFVERIFEHSNRRRQLSHSSSEPSDVADASRPRSAAGVHDVDAPGRAHSQPHSHSHSQPHSHPHHSQAHHSQAHHSQNQTQTQNQTQNQSRAKSQTGAHRQGAAASQLQRAEDALFLRCRELARGDASYAQVKKVVAKEVHSRSCEPPAKALEAALEAVPASIRTGLAYDPSCDARFEDLARRSYDVTLALACCRAVWLRVRKTTERSWRAGYNALLLLQFLLSAGSEVVVASALEHLGDVCRLMRLAPRPLRGSLRGRRDNGRSGPVMVARLAGDVYATLMDLKVQWWERAPAGGHRLFLAGRAKKEAAEVRSAKCAAVPLPRFRELHEGPFNPSVSVKTSPPPMAAAPPPPPPRARADLIGLGDSGDSDGSGIGSAMGSAMGSGSGSNGTAPPPPPAMCRRRR